MDVNGTPIFCFSDMSRSWRAIMREGAFTHVFRDKLTSFTLIHKIDHIVKISEPSVLTESYNSIF
jgi:hypothetical protein